MTSRTSFAPDGTMEVVQETGRKVALKGQTQIRGALAGLYWAAPCSEGNCSTTS